MFYIRTAFALPLMLALTLPAAALMFFAHFVHTLLIGFMDWESPDFDGFLASWAGLVEQVIDDIKEE